MPIRVWTVTLLCWLAAPVSAADEAVVLKFRNTAKGEVTKTTLDDSTTMTVDSVMYGKKKHEENSNVVSAVFTEEILEFGADGCTPTKITRAYEKLSVTRDGKTLKHELVGKTVLIEAGKDAYTFTADGKPVNADATTYLAMSFKKPDQKNRDMQEVFAPKEAVKVGSKWELDQKAMNVLAQTMGADAEKMKSSAELKRLYSLDNVRFGVVAISIELPITKSKSNSGVATDAKAGSRMSVTMTLDTCVDGSATTRTVEVTTNSKIGLVLGGADYDLTTESKSKMTLQSVKKK